MYPSEVQGFIDFLDEYTENDTLETCHIMHLHPKGLAYPNGYYDSQFFELVIYNTETMQKRNVGKRDGLVFYDNAHIDLKHHQRRVVQVFMHPLGRYEDGLVLCKSGSAEP